jgi:hypothetical protein
MLRLINIAMLPIILVIGMFMLIAITNNRKLSLAKATSYNPSSIKVDYLLDKEEYKLYKSLRKVINEHSYQILPHIPVSKLLNGFTGDPKLTVDFLITDYDFKPLIGIAFSSREESNLLNNVLADKGINIIHIQNADIQEDELKEKFRILR